MFLGQIFNSISAWQKLAGINMKPKLAYKILKYTKLVTAEAEIVRKQQEAIICEIKGEVANIAKGTPEFTAYAAQFDPVLQTESDLPQLDVNFEEVVNGVDEKGESIAIQDLAFLEPFFADYVEPKVESVEGE